MIDNQEDSGACRSGTVATQQSPSPSGLGPSGECQLAEPVAGAWVIWRDYGINRRLIERVTPKLIKLTGRSCPRQLSIADRSIICYAPDEKTSALLSDQFAGCDGECEKRVRAAVADYNARRAAAYEARDKAIAGIIARTTGAA